MQSFCLAAALMALGSYGCSSVRKLDIDSKPPGASIFVNGEKKGTTRSAVEIDFGAAPRVLIQIVKPRYKPAFQYLTEEEIAEESPKQIFNLEAE